MDKITEAICFVSKAFDGKYRKCEKSPAVLHSLETSVIAQTLTCDQDVVVAAVLHDTVEDAGVTLDEIKEKFGERVATLVNSETENKRVGMNKLETWRIRKEEAIEVLKNTDDLGVKIIFLSDKLSNIRSFYRTKLLYGDKMWDMFNQKDPKQHEWYFKEILSAVPEFKDSIAYQECVLLTNIVFS